MNHLYMCTSDLIRQYSSEYRVCEETPRLLKAYPNQPISLKNMFHSVYWYLISRGKYRIWCVYDGDTVIHTSYVIPKCIKFPFLSEESYEIGPCYTNKAYRGKGIYPAALTKIVSERRGTAFMIIEEHNLPSIKGVLKVGFSLMPGYIKKDIFKRFLYRKGE